MNRLAILALFMAACDATPAPPMNAGPADQCTAVRTAYVQHATNCGEYFGLRQYQADQQPADCATAVSVTRPEDVAVCVSWLSDQAPCAPDSAPNTACLGLFVTFTPASP